MHFPFDDSPHFKGICANSKSEVGKNIDSTSCGIWHGLFFFGTKRGEHPHLSCVRTWLCPEPTRPNFAPLQVRSSIPRHYFFPNHILLVLNTIHTVHFSSGENSSKKCIVLDSPLKYLYWLMSAQCHCPGVLGTGSQMHSCPTPLRDIMVNLTHQQSCKLHA